MKIYIAGKIAGDRRYRAKFREAAKALEAANNLYEFGQIMARNLRKMNRDGRGQEDADDLTADIMLACTAIGYVAEFAVDKCRFMPVRGNEKGKGKGR